jgi:SAM-dependent methyltransferase
MNKNKFCPICKKNNIHTLTVTDDYLLNECKVCKFIWDPGLYESLLSQYDKEYFTNSNPKGGYANYFESVKINRITFQERIKKITNLLDDKGLMLDVGCAFGDSLIEAKKMGWKVKGLEVSKFAASVARKNKIEIHLSTLRNSKFNNNSFDAITYQDVIEHIPDPLEEVKFAYKLLKKGGVIYLVTPNIGGVWSKSLKKYWYHFKKGEHISYFNYESAKALLKKSGFKEIVAKRTYHVFSLDYILNRLKYYNKPIFGKLQYYSKKLKLSNLPFRVYTGELEAWGIK